MSRLRRLDALLQDDRPADSPAAVLSCHRLTKTFGALVAVNKLSFEVEKGVVFGIGGPNGAGKTTLLDLICGVTPVTSGDIIFNGRSIAGKQAFEICRAGIARTFQLNAAFETMTVRENVLIASQHGARQAEFPRLTFDRIQRHHATEVLESCGLKDKAEQTVSRLSMFDHKLMMIASAVATQPSVLLLDEPVAGLIPSEIDQVEKVIRKLIEDHSMTVILIEHVMRFLVGLSDQVMIMNHGEKLYQGSARGLSKDKQVVEVYLGEGTSARLGVLRDTDDQPADAVMRSGRDDAHAPSLASDAWSAAVEAAARQLVRQHRSGRIYPIDYMKLERLLEERADEDRPTFISRAARDLFDARRKREGESQKFEFLERALAESARIGKIAAPQTASSKSEQAHGSQR